MNSLAVTDAGKTAPKGSKDGNLNTRPLTGKLKIGAAAAVQIRSIKETRLVDRLSELPACASDPLQCRVTRRFFMHNQSTT